MATSAQQQVNCLLSLQKITSHQAVGNKQWRCLALAGYKVLARAATEGPRNVRRPLAAALPKEYSYIILFCALPTQEQWEQKQLCPKTLSRNQRTRELVLLGAPCQGPHPYQSAPSGHY